MKIDTPVLIAGGGPVGMTLALELANHGVKSILVERSDRTTRHPKMDLTNGRSMELYRRLGVSERLRAVGVPPDHAFDIMWATSPSGHLLHNFKYPSASAKRSDMDRANDGSGTAEPGMRISQIVLEPELRKAIEMTPLVDVLLGWTFDRCEQDEEGVSSTIVNERSGERKSFRSLYLAGCDGGNSRVRSNLEIALEGTDKVRQLMAVEFRKAGIDVSNIQNIVRVMMIHFRSAERDVLNPWGIAWHLQTATGSLVAQDDVDTWTVHIPLLPGTDESKLDPAAILREFVGCDFAFQILVANPWTPQLVIAERYIEGRVILAGDSAHQVIPSGGYGMNTGVGDAVDLGWKLAATLNGWGGPELLQSYEIERHAIAVQNRIGSERHFMVRMKIAAAFRAAMASGGLDEAGAAGEQRRATLASEIAELGNAENECWGIEHGYRYANSPIVADEAGTPPPWSPLKCVPTTFPGARLPHVVLEDNTYLFDRLGREFTLLAIGNIDSGDFKAEAAAMNIPLTIVRLDEEPLLERKLLLVRPDQHIAWRGDAAVPSRPVLTRAIGHAEARLPSASSEAIYNAP